MNRWVTEPTRWVGKFIFLLLLNGELVAFVLETWGDSDTRARLLPLSRFLRPSAQLYLEIVYWRADLRFRVRRVRSAITLRMGTESTNRKNRKSTLFPRPADEESDSRLTRTKLEVKRKIRVEKAHGCTDAYFLLSNMLASVLDWTLRVVAHWRKSSFKHSNDN